MITLNLLPDIKREYLKTRRNKRFIVVVTALVSGGLLVLVVAGFIYTKFGQAQHADNLKADIDNAVSEIKKTQDLNKILTVNSQLEVLPELHEDKPLSSRLLQYLLVLTPDTVSISEVSIKFSDDEGSKIVASGVAKDVADINIFADTLKNATYAIDAESESVNAFSQVAVPSYGSVSDENGGDLGVAFSVETLYDPEIFSGRNPDIKLSVPNITSSRANQETPSLLFDDQGEQ
jgi:Tfp pilus assembly protein PilN